MQYSEFSARTKLPIYTKFNHITHLLLSYTPKPILSILQLISVSITSSHNTSFIRSVTLSPSLLSSSLKISCISKSLIRGVVSSYLIQYLLLLIPLVRCTAFKHYNKLILLILSISKVMPSYSYCIKRGLLYITIASPSSCQLLSCTECTTINMRFSCNIYLVSNAECEHLIALFSCYVLYLICFRVLDLICC